MRTESEQDDALTPTSRPTASLRIPADFHPISSIHLIGHRPEHAMYH